MLDGLVFSHSYHGPVTKPIHTPHPPTSPYNLHLCRSLVGLVLEKLDPGANLYVLGQLNLVALGLWYASS